MNDIICADDTKNKPPRGRHSEGFSHFGTVEKPF